MLLHACCVVIVWLQTHTSLTCFAVAAAACRFGVSRCALQGVAGALPAILAMGPRQPKFLAGTRLSYIESSAITHTCVKPSRTSLAPAADEACTAGRVLVCRYARSLSLAARQNTPAIDDAISHPNSTSYQLQPSFHTSWTEPEPTARARRAGKEFY